MKDCFWNRSKRGLSRAGAGISWSWQVLRKDDDPVSTLILCLSQAQVGTLDGRLQRFALAADNHSNTRLKSDGRRIEADGQGFDLAA